jgi:hypothetical protein
MEFRDIVNEIVKQAISGARRDYALPGQTEKLEGSLAGLEACLNKTQEELLEVLKEADEYVTRAAKEVADNYWWFRCYQAEVEHVCRRCNVLRR